jgi:hypothetical protein
MTRTSEASRSKNGPSFGVQLLPIAVRPKGSREAAVRLTELEQNQDKLLPNLRATHIGASLVLAWGVELFLLGRGAGACVVLR